jgi:hypothetical protein
LQLTLKPSPGRSRNGAQATFGTPAGATTGMGGIATTTGAGMDAMVGLAIIEGLVVLATTVGLVVLATMVEVLAAIADQLALPVIVATGSVLALSGNDQLTESIWPTRG